MDHLKNKLQSIDMIYKNFLEQYQESFSVYKNITSSYEINDKVASIIMLSDSKMFDSVCLVGTKQFPRSTIIYKIEKIISQPYWLIKENDYHLYSFDLNGLFYLKLMDGIITNIK